MSLSLSILVDNNPSDSQEKIEYEHGFSMAFNYDSLNWLFDVGASGVYANNAALIGINISKTDKLILSHSHNDHTGGIVRFLAENSIADIYVSCNIEDNRYYTSRHGEVRYIGINNKILQEYDHRFIYIKSNIMLSENVAVISQFTDMYTKPSANRFLFVENKQMQRYKDNFNHETAIIINTEQGLVVLSACSHNGVLNILHSATEYMKTSRVTAFVGGTHLIDEQETPQQISEFCNKFKTLYPHTKLYTGHCTGKETIKKLKHHLGELCFSFCSGSTIYL